MYFKWFFLFQVGNEDLFWYLLWEPGWAPAGKYNTVESPYNWVPWVLILTCSHWASSKVPIIVLVFRPGTGSHWGFCPWVFALRTMTPCMYFSVSWALRAVFPYALASLPDPLTVCSINVFSFYLLLGWSGNFQVLHVDLQIESTSPFYQISLDWMKLIFVPQNSKLVKFSRHIVFLKTTFSMAFLLEGLAYLDKKLLIRFFFFFPWVSLKSAVPSSPCFICHFWEAWCCFHMLCYYFALRPGGKKFFFL